MPAYVVLFAVLASISGWALCVLSIWRSKLVTIGISPLGENVVLIGSLLVASFGISCFYFLFDHSGLPTIMLWAPVGSAGYSLTLWLSRDWLSKTDGDLLLVRLETKRRISQIAVLSGVTTVLLAIPLVWAVWNG